MKKWFKLALLILIFALISLGFYLIFKLTGITNLENLKQVISSSGKYAIPVFCIVEILCFSLLCFIPILEPTLTVVGILFFGPIKTFFITWFAQIMANSLMFFIGDKFGEKLAIKLIGKDEFERAQNLVDVKSKIYLPLFFAIPGFPDDAISLVAGMTKMKFWFFAIISFVFCAVDTFTVCFLGSGLIEWSKLTFFDYLITANIIIIDFYLLKKLQKFLENKKK